MEEKAQVNLEYLLILVGAIAIVTIVSLYIKSTANVLTDSAKEQTNTP